MDDGFIKDEMKHTLTSLLLHSLKQNGIDVINLPSQILCVSEMVNFTESTYKAIEKGLLHSFKEELEKRLDSNVLFDTKGDSVIACSKAKSTNIGYHS